MDMDVNEHERLPNMTQIKVKEQHFYNCDISYGRIGASQMWILKHSECTAPITILGVRFPRHRPFWSYMSGIPSK